MEYRELYEAWKKEVSSEELQVLPKEFYREAADYMKRILSSMRMLDEDTVKAKLLRKELENVQRMIKDLLSLRYRKMLKGVLYDKPVREEALTEEERKVYTKIYSLRELIDSLIKNVLEGKYTIEEKLEERKYILVRFLKDTPAIVGSDMRIYGPFKPEDLATLPVYNSRMLIKQGVAVEVETR
ncbi:MAG: hypothetical protein QXL67_01510 [Candidatus Bathyarchaeia archaeon]